YILSQKLPVENGVNRIMIRSTLKAGEITISAKFKGLQSAKINLKSKPFLSKNGLADQLPSDTMPSYLERGATPETPSYTIKRTPVFISHATAISNADDVYKS